MHASISHLNVARVHRWDKCLAHDRVVQGGNKVKRISELLSFARLSHGAEDTDLQTGQGLVHS